MPGKSEVPALDLLWQIHFYGHEFLDDSPLFPIRLKETKRLFGLDEKAKRFSYAILKHTLDLGATNLPIVKKLLTHHFAKAFYSPENRSGRTTLELSALSSGLWVKREGKNLSVLSASSAFPWHRLTTGMIIAENPDLLSIANSRKEIEILTEAETLLGELVRYEKLAESSFEKDYKRLFERLSLQKKDSKEIGLQLEQEYPLSWRLANAGELFKVLPGRNKTGEWYSLHALGIRVYNPVSGRLEGVKNFTPYSDTLFEQIRESYFRFREAFLKQDNESAGRHMVSLSGFLKQGYATLIDKPYASALGKKLSYPSFGKLNAEAFYSSFPLTNFCIFGYLLSSILYFLAFRLRRNVLFTAAFIAISMTFLFHTVLLALRSYILGRPPVANMLETVLYVPWIAVAASLAFRIFSANSLPLAASSVASVILLSLLRLNFYPTGLENVQAVLDSHYWLSIHVLMVVGSYGLFLLAALLGHIYLAGSVYLKQETPGLEAVSRALLKMLYSGVVLLVAGTLLGGVWAAQSWGRFWDWDPKESWAFISICVYLLWIHAFRFGRIHRFGLAVGSILGFLSISFTWYGVNYILGTGLHSYGFGTGGTFYYYSFISCELLFLAAICKFRILPKAIDSKKNIW